MKTFPNSDRILNGNLRRIPGGTSSLNRLADPNIVFVQGKGSRLIDAEGNEYIDYHGAFAPQILGYGHADVRSAVTEAINGQVELFGAGPTELEGVLADLICSQIPWIEQVAFLNSGSEATAQAIRLARAATRRDHIIVMQGGYNGWHNDVACNLMTPLSKLGPRRSPGEYEFHAMSAGIPKDHQKLVHPINFNDAASVRYVCERYSVAGVILEPVLQNIGVIKPNRGYLEELRSLADEFGFVLIFDEIKTGFRSGIGGYANISGVRPDLVLYGKAIANGYPLAAIGGSSKLMQYFAHPDPDRRVLLAGTYNAHPMPVAAAIATIEVLSRNNGALYQQLETLSCSLVSAIDAALRFEGIETTIVRQGSAFAIYFMDHAPQDWHDLASHHDYQADRFFRRHLIDNGIFFFPVETKQCSLSAAHTSEDIAVTIEAVRKAARELMIKETSA